jgi:hypothetical protein
MAQIEEVCLMESERFDRIVRSLTVAPSRRGLVQIIPAGLLAAVGWHAASDPASEAKSKKKKKKKCKPKCDKECEKCDKKKGKCKAVADGTACDSADVCEGGACVPFRCGNGGPCTVFVTNAGKVGSEIGGVLAGDAFCQSTAEAANLSGTFQAWLSEDASPSNRFTNRDKAGPYLLVPNDADGNNPPPTVASSFADLTNCNGGDCLQNAINRTEEGLVLEGNIGVWTGTLADGTSGPESCEGFTGGGDGLTGNATAVNDDWTNSNEADCASDFRLYCFEQA